MCYEFESWGWSRKRAAKREEKLPATPEQKRAEPKPAPAKEQAPEVKVRETTPA